MTDALEDFDGGISCGGRKIGNLIFADDIDLIAKSKLQLQDLADRLTKLPRNMEWKLSEKRAN